jgi:hypothetical protein
MAPGAALNNPLILLLLLPAVLEALNQLPRQQHGTDIMRVRLHLLASQGQHYRQTIMSSSFAAPQLNAAFSSFCCSHAGKFRLVAQPTGVLGQVVPQVVVSCVRSYFRVSAW